jgi:hypothetical protein
VPGQGDHEVAHPVGRALRHSEALELDPRERGAGDLVLAAALGVRRPFRGIEDRPVVPGGEPHELGLVGLLGELVHARQDVGEVLQRVEVATRPAPPLDQILADRPDLLRRSGRARPVDAADERRKEPLRCVHDAH